MSPLGATDGPLLHRKAQAEGSAYFDEQLRQAELRHLEESVARAEALQDALARWVPIVAEACLVAVGLALGWLLRRWLR